ncbi:MAG: helix-turn-helix domain containing protein [Candidatus Bathyarchaeota archaeon]
MTTLKTSKQLRKERERCRRRRDIIRAAEILFATKGFDGLMMDEIALEAGFSKATLYKYFETKEDLFLAMGASAIHRLCEILQEDKENGAQHGVSEMAGSFFKFLKENKPYMKIINDRIIRKAIGEIMKKEANGESLTESENELRINQQNSLKILIENVSATLGDHVKQIDPLTVAVALSNIFIGMGNDLINREILMTQTDDDTKNQIQLNLIP